MLVQGLCRFDIVQLRGVDSRKLIRKNRTRELCIMSHNEGLYPIIPRYISPFLIRRQLAALAAALAAVHYSLRIPSIHAICIDLIHYSMYCKDVLQTKYIQPNGM